MCSSSKNSYVIVKHFPEYDPYRGDEGIKALYKDVHFHIWNTVLKTRVYGKLSELEFFLCLDL